MKCVPEDRAKKSAFQDRANLFASLLMTALLLIAPDLTHAAGPASQPTPARGAYNANYAPRSKPELLVEQFRVLEPLGQEVSVGVGEFRGPAGPSRVVNIAADSHTLVEKAKQALAELDNVAVGAAAETRAFQLRHARAREAVESLANLLKSRDVVISIDERTNRLLVAAPEPQLKRAGELVQLLDVPAEEAPELRVNIYSVRHANLDTLKGPLGLLMSGGGGGGEMPAAWGTFALDAPSRQVIVQGTPKMFEQVEALLAKLDVPPPATKPAESPQAVQIRLIWLTTANIERNWAPPADTAEIVREMGQFGVHNLSMVTQTVVPAVVGQEFNISGAATLGRPVELKVTGVVAGADMLQIQLGVRGPAERAPAPPGAPPGYTPPTEIADLVNIQTTVVAPPNQSVVLGVSSQTDHQDVFIIQVRALGK